MVDYRKKMDKAGERAMRRQKRIGEVAAQKEKRAMSKIAKKAKGLKKDGLLKY